MNVENFEKEKSNRLINVYTEEWKEWLSPETLAEYSKFGYYI